LPLSEELEPDSQIVMFRKAVDLVGARPSIDAREDLIFRNEPAESHWHWSRKIGMALPEAIELHQEAHDTVIIVTDELNTDSSWKRRMTRVVRREPRSPMEVQDALMPPAKGPRGEGAEWGAMQRAQVSPEPVPTVEHAMDEIQWQSTVSASTLATPTEALPAKPPLFEEPPAEVGQVVAQETHEVDTEYWFGDYVTAGLGISSVLMLGPELASALLAAQTFLPIFFVGTQLSFIFGTLAAFATRDYRKPRVKKLQQ
jgi:hypothetical protein